jgi:hypothetical protein
MKKIVVTSHIPEPLYEEIRNKSFENRISIAEFIRQACEAKIELIDLKEQKDGEN